MSGPVRIYFTIVCANVFSLSAFAEAPGGEQIVVTVPYIAELIKEVSCGDADLKVKTLVSTGTDTHTYKLTPADRTSIARATKVFYIGAGFESWLMRGTGNVLQNSHALTSGLKLSSLETKGDPHIWHSPKLTVESSHGLVKELSKLIPAKTDKLIKCQKEFERKVENEIADLKSKVHLIPKKARILATNHDAFGYLAETFDFKVLSLVGISTEAAPTPTQLTNIIKKVSKENVKAVFVETSASEASMQTVSKQTGVRIGGTLHADGLGPVGSGADTIIGLWRTNLETIITALK